MKILPKDQSAQLLGQSSFDLLIDKVTYLSGLSDFDAILGERGPKQSGIATYLEPHEKGLSVQLVKGWNKHYLPLLRQNLLYVVIEKQEVIREQKSKSVVGRALVGGLLLGPVGALVGGMSGLGNKEVKVGDTPDNLLVIGIRDEKGNEHAILFEVTNKRLSTVEGWVQKHYGDLPKPEPVPETPAPATTTVSVADELIKLKSLLDAGVLTQEEFNTQKARILS